MARRGSGRDRFWIRFVALRFLVVCMSSRIRVRSDPSALFAHVGLHSNLGTQVDQRRTFCSYAEAFEDLILFRSLAGVSYGMYIDVVVNDPHKDLVTKPFILK
jgi:hypothetical protein